MTTHLLNRQIHFWRLQLAAWSTYAAATVAGSYPFWHVPDYIRFTIGYICCGFLGSLLMRLVCRELWRRQVPILTSAGVCVLFALFLGSVFIAVCLKFWYQCRRYFGSHKALAANYRGLSRMQHSPGHVECALFQH